MDTSYYGHCSRILVSVCPFKSHAAKKKKKKKLHKLSTRIIKELLLASTVYKNHKVEIFNYSERSGFKLCI